MPAHHIPNLPTILRLAQAFGTPSAPIIVTTKKAAR